MKLTFLEIPTVVPKDGIACEAIPHVKSKIAENVNLCTKDKTIMKQFWKHSQKQWMSLDKMIALCKISNDYGTDKFCDIHDRTNNGMER